MGLRLRSPGRRRRGARSDRRAPSRGRRDPGLARRRRRADRPTVRPLRRPAAGSARALGQPPFEPTVDAEWLVARGVADDKGQLYMLLKAAALLADARALPVNVWVACDGEE